MSIYLNQGDRQQTINITENCMVMWKVICAGEKKEIRVRRNRRAGVGVFSRVVCTGLRRGWI